MTKRQEQYLKKIIENFIETGKPISSQEFILKNKINVSSATIRNEMHILEQEGYLEKEHISAGRIPSIKGYELFAKQLVNNNFKNNNTSFERKINQVLHERLSSIDYTLDKAASIISEMTNLTLVTSTKIDNNESLKSIHLTSIDKNMGIIVLVTSIGRVESKMFNFNNFISINDVRIAIRVFKERLINTPLKEIANKIKVLTPIFAKIIKNYELIIQEFISQIFNFKEVYENKVYGNYSLVKRHDIKREDLANLLNLIESHSIWSTIEGKLEEDENMKINIQPNNISIISKKIIMPSGVSKEISVVGSNRINYLNAKKALLLLEKILLGKK